MISWEIGKRIVIRCPNLTKHKVTQPSESTVHYKGRQIRNSKKKLNIHMLT
jgi:hypothetical protein